MILTTLTPDSEGRGRYDIQIPRVWRDIPCSESLYGLKKEIVPLKLNRGREGLFTVKNLLLVPTQSRNGSSRREDYKKKTRSPERLGTDLYRVSCNGGDPMVAAVTQRGRPPETSRFVDPEVVDATRRVRRQARVFLVSRFPETVSEGRTGSDTSPLVLTTHFNLCPQSTLCHDLFDDPGATVLRIHCTISMLETSVDRVTDSGGLKD